MSEEQSIAATDELPPAPVVPVDLEEGKVYNQTPRFMHMRHLEWNVVEAAKARIRWCISNFDDVWVSFSGGKDSLVVLKLVEQVYEELGITEKIKVKFMDEEIVCDDIIDFVFEVAESGKYDFHWYALQMYVGFYVMGKHKPFVSWDPERKWHRQPPDRPYVIYDVGHPTRDENENSISKFMYKDTSRRTVELLGLRADESMKRYLSVKAGGISAPNYLSNGMIPHIYAGKPIYDFTETDIFKFFKDHGIKYCPFYDVQVWSKSPLRVASTMHERGQAQFFKMKELAPKYYEQLRQLFPEVETHYRYGQEMAVGQEMELYPHSWEGIRQYIADKIDPGHKAEALEFVKRYEIKRIGQLRDNPGKPLGGVSMLKVFRQVMNGRFVKSATLLHEITQADIDYEQ